MLSITHLATELAAGRTTARALLESTLARIADPAGEGARAYLKVYAQAALAEADASDALRAAGIVRSPIEGLPISIKDLFDVGGDVTLAGSKALATQEPADCDAPAVARLRAAGAVVVGKTAMTEFAFGGVGTNPHFGTPRNAYGREPGGGGRVPGGSSSGAGVAVADGLCVMGLGSDTRGSVRIPAALNGVTGFKPTQRRVPREGAFPLSYTLDSVGPLASCVADCAVFDAILSGETPPALAAAPPALPLGGLRLMAPSSASYLMEGLEPPVAAAFEKAVATLTRRGVLVASRDAPVFARAHALFDGGGFAGPESYHVHRALLESHGDAYDPNVAARIKLGAEMSAAHYVHVNRERAVVIGEAAALLAPFDAMVLPTVPCVAPTIAECDASAEAYAAVNMKLLRNPGLINMLDGCAITLPCHAKGDAPVGLMIAGVRGSDAHTLAVARAVEAALQDELGAA